MKLEHLDLDWRQPEALKRHYQLGHEAETVATLKFEKSCGSLATGVFGADQWTFKRSGFLSPRVSIRKAGSEIDHAIFTPSWTGSGWAAFDTGRRYHLRATNFWATEWAFEAEDGSQLVVLTGPHGRFKQGGDIHVGASATGL